MKRVLLLAVVLAVAGPAFADDVDIVPHGFVSKVIRETQLGTSPATEVSNGEAPLTATGSGSKVLRAQVAAETREAARLGLLHSGEAGPVQATPAQEALIRAVGQRAVGIEAASR